MKRLIFSTTVFCTLVLSGCNPVKNISSSIAQAPSFDSSISIDDKNALNNFDNILIQENIFSRSEIAAIVRERYKFSEINNSLSSDNLKKYAYINSFVKYNQSDIYSDVYKKFLANLDSQKLEKYLLEERAIDEKIQASIAENERESKRQSMLKQKAEQEIKAVQAKVEQELKLNQQNAYDNALKELYSYNYGKKTINIITNVWDDKSREELKQSPNKIFALNTDVETGVYDKVLPYAEKIKKNYSEIKSSDLEYYMRGSAQFFKELEDKRKEKIERLASNETQLDANIYWHVSQINEKKLKLSKQQQGSAAYSEIAGEIAYLTKELSPLEEAKALIKQRETDASNRKLAQEREYQNQQLQQQRQAQQAQADYQRRQLEIEKEKLKQAKDEADSAFWRNLNNDIRRNQGTTCVRMGNIVNCN